MKGRSQESYWSIAKVSAGLPVLLTDYLQEDMIEQNQVPPHPPLPLAKTQAGDSWKRAPFTSQKKVTQKFYLKYRIRGYYPVLLVLPLVLLLLTAACCTLCHRPAKGILTFAYGNVQPTNDAARSFNLLMSLRSSGKICFLNVLSVRGSTASAGKLFQRQITWFEKEFFPVSMLHPLPFKERLLFSGS